MQLPAEFLRRGFLFVDTPGLGSAIEENTRTTESYLPEADAYLLVTSFDGPLSEEEMRFFREACCVAAKRLRRLEQARHVSDQERGEAIELCPRQTRRDVQSRCAEGIFDLRPTSAGGQASARS